MISSIITISISSETYLSASRLHFNVNILIIIIIFLKSVLYHTEMVKGQGGEVIDGGF